MKTKTKATKAELLRQVEELEREEAGAAKRKEQEANYKKFKDRREDAIIGMAHCDIEIGNINNRWESSCYTLGQATSISGNCGTSYNAKASITSATHRYFHNVWSDAQERAFQAVLNRLAAKEVMKIMGSLRCVLEIMGLQSDSYYLKELYPANKVKKIEAEIWEETKARLDKFKDGDFKKLLATDVIHWVELETGEPRPNLNLSHSKHILKRYLNENRPKLLTLFKKKNCGI